MSDTFEGLVVEELLRVQCTICMKWKDPLEFRPHPGKRNGISSNCKSCNREMVKLRMRLRRADPVESELVKQHKLKYARSEKGRARKRRSSETYNHKRRQRSLALPWQWTPEDWRLCKLAWGTRCAYCGIGGELTQDHFIPISDPDCPGTVPWNIVPACIKCNCSKQGTHPDEWCRNEGLRSLIEDRLRGIGPLIISPPRGQQGLHA